MADEFKVIGDQVHFGPWVVATLKEGIPTTIRDSVVHYIERATSAYNDGWRDGLRDASEENNG